jgi:uncharacterized repeat protein (TIGR01451 family)
MKKTKLVFTLFIILLIIYSGLAAAEGMEYMDMNNWIRTGRGNANWSITNGGRDVVQSINGDPIFFVSNKEYQNIVFKSTIKVNTSGDDDFIGVVAAYQNPMDTISDAYKMILFDWKQTYQNYDGYHAKDGITLIDIEADNLPIIGPSGTEAYSNRHEYFWSRTDTGPNPDQDEPKFDVLDFDHGNYIGSTSKGWEDYKKYQFEMLITTSRIKIKIDGDTVFEESGNFEPGRVGFYNYSQEDVEYGSVQIGDASETRTAPVSQEEAYGVSPGEVLDVNKFEGVLKNDYDPNLDDVYIELVENVSHGALNLDTTTGAFRYTPDSDFSGGDYFKYKLVEVDSAGNETGFESEIQTVTLGVIADNQAPTDISIDKDVVAANSAEGTLVGEFSTEDENENDEHDYILTDNSDGRFKVVDNQLQVAGDLLGSPGTAHSVSVKSTDLLGESTEKDFTIKVGIDFTDQNLKNALIDNGVDTNGDGEITTGEADIPSISMTASGIKNLKGLEYFNNLSTLSAGDNNISDLTPLKNLNSLNYLNLSENNIDDLSPLSGLHNLSNLSLSNNNISDLSPISGLSKLTYLYLSRNQITDISALGNMTALQNLVLSYNNIISLAPLSEAEFNDLTNLSLSGNKISDLSPLEDLPLVDLLIGDNEITDIAPLSSLKLLERLWLEYNYGLKDIRALLGLSIDEIRVTESALYDSSAENAVNLGAISAYSGPVEVWIPAGFITAAEITETELDGSAIEIEIYPTTFADNSLDKANFNLANAPAGLSIESVDYIDQNNCRVNLAFNGDIDSDISNLEINIDAVEFSNGQSANITDEYGNTFGDSLNFSDGMPVITADNDPESITIADDGELIIGAEAGEVITVKITGGKFVGEEDFDSGEWIVANLPEVAAVGSLVRIDNNTAEITLSGNSNPDDYSENITNLSVTVPVSQYIDSSGDGDLTADSGVTILDNNPPKDYHVSFVQDYVNLNNKNSISFSLSNAEVGTTYNYSIDDQDDSIEAVSGSGTVNAAEQTISEIDLRSLNDGELTLTVTLTDDAGNEGSGATAAVEKDTVKPYIKEVIPADDSNNAGIDDELKITFNEKVKINQADIYLKKYSDDSLIETISLDSERVTFDGENELIMDFYTELQPDTGYYLEIEKGAAVDLAANEFEGINEKNVWNFTTVSRPKINLTLEAKDENGGVLLPGEIITYYAEIENIGGADLIESQIFASIPSNTIYVKNSTKINGKAAADISGESPLLNGHTINTANSDSGIILSDGEKIELSYQVEVSEDAVFSGVIENQLELQGKGEKLSEPIKPVLSDDPGTKAAGDLTKIYLGETAVLELQKEISKVNDIKNLNLSAAELEDSNIGPGDKLEIKSRIINTGNIKAVDVNLNEKLPENTNFVEGSLQKVHAQAELPYKIEEDSILLDLGDLEAGSEVEISYQVIVDGDLEAGEAISSSGTISSEQTGSEDKSVDLVIGKSPLLKSAISVRDLNGGEIEVGDELEYKILVENSGNTRAAELKISNEIPAELEYRAGSTKLNGEELNDIINGSSKLEEGLDYGLIEAGEIVEIRYKTAVAEIDMKSKIDQSNIQNEIFYEAVAKSKDTGSDSDRKLSGSSAISIQPGAAPGSVKILGEVKTNSAHSPADWILELCLDDRNESILGRVELAHDGKFSFTGLSANRDYRLLLKHPETEVVYAESKILSEDIKDAAILEAENLLMDPQGKIYDSISREVVSGAEVVLLNKDGDPVPDNYLSAGQQKQITAADGFYRFDLNFAEADAGIYKIKVIPPAGYINKTPSSLIEPLLDPSEEAFDPTSENNPYKVVDSEDAPQEGEKTSYYLSFDLEAGDPNIINNHIPIDPNDETLLTITKTADKDRASVGDYVKYLIKIKNNTSYDISDFELYDKLPTAFKYVENSAVFYNSDQKKYLSEPEGIKLLKWEAQNLNSGEELLLSYSILVGTGIEADQEYINKAYAVIDNNLISNTAQETVIIDLDAVFSQSTIFGKVFRDSNQNGIQDNNEEGISGAVLVTNMGQEIKTDEYGRYSINLDSESLSSIGKTIIIKLLESSLGEEEKIMVNNPVILNLSTGVMKKVNFRIK